MVDGAFDWGGVTKPATPLDKTVIYETHAKGLSKLNPAVPEEFRGTYAGLAHDSTIAYLKDLGVTAVELLPVHQFVTEPRLAAQGLVNYWGYNTLAFFTPHGAYASNTAQAAGPAQVLREFKGMVRLLHDAGLEVILDVVYNHTAELGPDGPTTSFRGLDNATYYRHTADGRYTRRHRMRQHGEFRPADPAAAAPGFAALLGERGADRRFPVRPRRRARAATTNVDFRRDHPLLHGDRGRPATSRA